MQPGVAIHNQLPTDLEQGRQLRQRSIRVSRNRADRNGELFGGFLLPEPLHPLVVHGPTLPPQQALGHATAPADVIRCDLPEAPPKLGLLQIHDLAAMALGAAVLPHHPGRPGVQRPGNAPAGLVRRLRHFDPAADIVDGLALGDQPSFVVHQRVDVMAAGAVWPEAPTA